MVFARTYISAEGVTVEVVDEVICRQFWWILFRVAVSIACKAPEELYYSRAFIDKATTIHHVSISCT